MKKLFLILCVILLSGGFLLLHPNRENKNRDNTVLPTLTPPDKPFAPKEVDYRENYYGYVLYKVKKGDRINLIPNFAKKMTSVSVKKDYDCRLTVNAGFYDKKDRPIGLFRNFDGRISPQQKNNLLNGFLSVDRKNRPLITDYIGDNFEGLALQSGPLLINNSGVYSLKIIDDEGARRSVAAVSDQDLYFMSVFKKDTLLDGPYLADLPGIIMEIGKRENIKFEAALNLDGGAASAFLSAEANLQEMTNVGGFFCIK